MSNEFALLWPFESDGEGRCCLAVVAPALAAELVGALEDPSFLALTVTPFWSTFLARDDAVPAPTLFRFLLLLAIDPDFFPMVGGVSSI